MPPRKRAPNSSSSSSSSKTLKKTTLNAQASKFGIQHFFDRHSQSQAAAASAQLSPPIQNDSSNRVLLPPLPIPLPRSSSNVAVVNGDDEKFFPLSPEITKMTSAKRLKFSPGSQDDGGDEITWKISQVNERLKSFTGKVLAGPGKLSVLGVCSKEKKCPGSVARFEKWATSSTSPKTLMGSHHNDTTLSVSTIDEQSPFRTTHLHYTPLGIQGVPFLSKDHLGIWINIRTRRHYLNCWIKWKMPSLLKIPHLIFLGVALLRL